MDIQEFNNTQWSRNVILVDGDYVDSVAFDLTVNFERILGRRINKADTARWIDCIAHDGGMREGRRDTGYIHTFKGQATARQLQPRLLREQPQRYGFQGLAWRIYNKFIPS